MTMQPCNTPPQSKISFATVLRTTAFVASATYNAIWFVLLATVWHNQPWQNHATMSIISFICLAIELGFVLSTLRRFPIKFPKLF
ncbi:MAG TPA: hypothetical protein VFV38_08750 [Ktedonobacteraceae bacterium]|nr:hypothetical protein [Ktedonobacteraceae bacterium]